MHAKYNVYSSFLNRVWAQTHDKYNVYSSLLKRVSPKRQDCSKRYFQMMDGKKVCVAHLCV